MNGFCLLLHPYNNNLSCRAFDRSCILPCISTFTSVCLSAAAVCTHVLCCLPFQLCFFLNLPMTEVYSSRHKPSEMWSSAESYGNLSRTWQETSCRGHQNKVKNTNGSQIGFFLFKQIFDASFNFGLKCDLDTVDFLHSYCWQTSFTTRFG